jgi:hypothetical protein
MTNRKQAVTVPGSSFKAVTAAAAIETVLANDKSDTATVARIGRLLREDMSFGRSRPAPLQLPPRSRSSGGAPMRRPTLRRALRSAGCDGEGLRART